MVVSILPRARYSRFSSGGHQGPHTGQMRRAKGPEDPQMNFTALEVHLRGEKQYNDYPEYPIIWKDLVLTFLKKCARELLTTGF